MLTRLTSSLFALTVAAAFLGWVRSHSTQPETTRIDEVLSASAIFSPPAKKKSSRQQVAEAAR
ncbi:MAG: hypothetical protein RL189_1521 [Pseudomonadota bacterium]